MTTSTRALRRSAATSGSSVTTAAKATPATTTTPARRPTVSAPSAPKKIVTNGPRPLYHFYIAPGVVGTPGKNMHFGTLIPDYSRFTGKHDRNRFTFHYNPAELDFDTSVNPSAAAGALINQGAAQNLYGMNSSVSFQFMIARQEEVASDAKLGHPLLMRFSSGQFASIHAKTFGQVGTLYDVEVLLRTVNGGLDVKEDTEKGIPQISVPFIYYTPAFLTFGKAFQFYGAVTDVSINHVMFTPKMVPTITYVQLSFQPISFNDPNLTAQTSAAFKSDLKNSSKKAKKHARSQGPSNPNG